MQAVNEVHVMCHLMCPLQLLSLTDTEIKDGHTKKQIFDWLVTDEVVFIHCCALVETT